MNRFLVFLFAVLVFTAPASAATYDIGMRSAAGTSLLTCGHETACKGAITIGEGHPAIQYTMEASGDFLIITFFQAGYHLSVQLADNRKAQGTFVLKTDTLKIGEPLVIPLVVSVPDAGNLKPAANEPNPKTAPVAIEITLTQVTR